MQEGDVAETCADVSNLDSSVNYKPSTSVREGIAQFTDWFSAYYGVKKASPAQKQVELKV